MKITIRSIDIKGQYINLAAPIELTGELKVAELLAERHSHSLQDLSSVPLQIGVDEAGRGPLLGSVNVAAAILPIKWSGLIEDQPLLTTPLAILTDSKQLSEKKRDILYPLVQQYALGYVIADIPAAVIDQLNILQATMLGMRLCTEQLLIAIYQQLTIDSACLCSHMPTQILYDGNRCPELDYPTLAKVGIEQATIDCQAWVKGDARHTSIAAASILAKVSRDHRMYQLDAQYPDYSIGKHKGYPTAAHMQAIVDYGVLPEHRRSFAPVKRALLEK
ncbi:ribonuclease HII [Psychrobacter urativorans]|uniref:ribonuclease HII n=1 Tax=Psychrobacter urativorans TaxID=45610 RepID=UPI00191B117E|nr:ribonuclease HII [Psychrobacter urativorans]